MITVWPRCSSWAISRRVWLRRFGGCASRRRGRGRARRVSASSRPQPTLNARPRPGPGPSRAVSATGRAGRPGSSCPASGRPIRRPRPASRSTTCCRAAYRPGSVRTVTRRRTKNNRLAAVGYSWAFTAAARPSPARDHYLRRREHGDGHPAALRHLFNKMLGQLHHCLLTGHTYDSTKAYPHALPRHSGAVAA